MKQSSKIIFFGNERLSSGFVPNGAPTLELLIKNGYDVVAVVAHFEPGTSRTARTLEIQEVAERHDIPVLLPEKLSDITDRLKSTGADTGVLVAYGKMVPESIIGLFKHGIINVHPSLLPLYRGSTPIEQAILDGARETGVSLMRLVKAMDAGPIFAQSSISLSGTETKHALTRTLLTLGGELLMSHLPSILDGSAQPWPQDDTKATYTQLFTKEQSKLDTTLPAQKLERAVRALADWPKSRLALFGHDIIVLEARVAASASDGYLVIPCGDSTYLEITKLTAPSGRTINGRDFMLGYKKTT